MNIDPAEARAASIAARKALADAHAKSLLREWRLARRRGWSTREFASHLNRQGIRTRTGHVWHSESIRRLCERLERLDAA